MIRFTSCCAALALLALSGCDCGTQTATRFPKIEVLDDEGNTRSSVDFGKVQLNLTSTQTIRIRNGGAKTLTISEVTFTDARFGVGVELPLTLAVNEESQFPLTFTPSEADQRITGTASIGSDDPDHPSVDVSVAGTGVAATAVVQPTSFEFGEVYVNESKSITFTLTNSGSNELPVMAAALTMADPSVTGDLTPLQKTLAGGETATITLTFAPTQPVLLMGELTLTLPDGVGDQHILLHGSGIQARPQLCFRFDDTQAVSCTDGVSPPSLEVRMGAWCDSNVYPEDGGIHCELDGGLVPYERTGAFFVRNAGNTPVSYTLSINAGTAARCDGGASIDFLYANAPLTADGGTQPSWMVSTTKLPMVVSDPMPWETTPVPVVYRPRSICRTGDASDLSTILWARQGEPLGTTRLPNSLVATLSGTSRLSNPQPNMVTFTGNRPAPQVVTLVSNTGDGPVDVLSAELWQSSDGGSVPDEPCATAVSGPCTHYAWTVPPALPVRLGPATMAGERVTQPIGTLAYGTFDADAGEYIAPSTEQKVLVKVGTSDPYTPVVVVPIAGRPN